MCVRPMIAETKVYSYKRRRLSSMAVEDSLFCVLVKSLLTVIVEIGQCRKYN